MDTTENRHNKTACELLAFSNDCVQDLAWAIFSPPLASEIETPRGCVYAPGFELTPTRRQWLQALDEEPAPLLNFLLPAKSRFLGIYFEALWRFFLLNDSEVTLLKYSQQMIDQGRTLGEFDIFYQCHRRNITVHLELAVKFYLGLPIHDATDLQRASFWLGPNCADRLDLKLAHLRTHQLALIDHAISQDWLNTEQLRPEIQEVAMHGYLFYPWQNGPRQNDSPSESNKPRDASPAHLSAFWLRDAELAQLQTDHSDHSFRIAPKMQWLCEHGYSTHRWFDFKTFSQLIADEFRTSLRQPVLCEEACSNAKKVVRRFFVAPEDWPALHWPKKKF